MLDFSPSLTCALVDWSVFSVDPGLIFHFSFSFFFLAAFSICFDFIRAQMSPLPFFIGHLIRRTFDAILSQSCFTHFHFFSHPLSNLRFVRPSRVVSLATSLNPFLFFSAQRYRNVFAVPWFVDIVATLPAAWPTFFVSSFGSVLNQFRQTTRSTNANIILLLNISDSFGNGRVPVFVSVSFKQTSNHRCFLPVRLVLEAKVDFLIGSCLFVSNCHCSFPVGLPLTSSVWLCNCFRVVCFHHYRLSISIFIFLSFSFFLWSRSLSSFVWSVTVADLKLHVHRLFIVKLFPICTYF